MPRFSNYMTHCYNYTPITQHIYICSNAMNEGAITEVAVTEC